MGYESVETYLDRINKQPSEEVHKTCLVGALQERGRHEEAKAWKWIIDNGKIPYNYVGVWDWFTSTVATSRYPKHAMIPDWIWDSSLVPNYTSPLEAYQILVYRLMELFKCEQSTTATVEIDTDEFKKVADEVLAQLEKKYEQVQNMVGLADELKAKLDQKGVEVKSIISDAEDAIDKFNFAVMDQEKCKVERESETTKLHNIVARGVDCESIDNVTVHYDLEFCERRLKELQLAKAPQEVRDRVERRKVLEDDAERRRKREKVESVFTSASLISFPVACIASQYLHYKLQWFNGWVSMGTFVVSVLFMWCFLDDWKKR